MNMTDLPERVGAKIMPTEDGCWLWTGGSTRGYGYARWDGKAVRVHRLVYRILVGPIPEGLELDHLCRVTLCVNPRHLEPVTHRENLRRGAGFPGVNARKTRCPAGHSLSGGNLLAMESGRKCKTCHRQRENRRYHQRKDHQWTGSNENP